MLCKSKAIHLQTLLGQLLSVVAAYTNKRGNATIWVFLSLRDPFWTPLSINFIGTLVPKGVGWVEDWVENYVMKVCVHHVGNKWIDLGRMLRGVCAAVMSLEGIIG